MNVNTNFYTLKIYKNNLDGKMIKHTLFYSRKKKKSMNSDKTSSAHFIYILTDVNFNGSLYHATCLTLICISKRPMQILYIVQTETPATLNIYRILDINTIVSYMYISLEKLCFSCKGFLMLIQRKYTCI